MDPRVIAYIRSEEAQGFTPVQLRAELMRHGYTAEQADAAIRYADREQIYRAPDHMWSEYHEADAEKRPKVVTVLAAVHFGCGGFATMIGLLFAAGGFGLVRALPGFLSGIGFVLYSFTIIMLALGVYLLLVGWGLWSMRRWGRLLALVFSAASLFTVVGIPLSAALYYYLTRAEIKKAFV